MSPIRKEVTIGDCRLILGDCLTRPDFSPAMLSFFLRARAHFAHGNRDAEGAQKGKHPARCGFQATAKREKAMWRKLARVTHAEMEFAWMGRLLSPAPRARLWGALGHVPGDYGILLTHGGQERADG
jgi:hypothetical protein